MGNEKYLRKIYQITGEGEESTTTSELAEEMKVTDASASEAVAKLEEKDLVCRAPYKGFTLSPVGKDKGKKILEKYQLLEKFFQQIGLEKPEDEAERIENDISKEAVKKIEEEIIDQQESS